MKKINQFLEKKIVLSAIALAFAFFLFTVPFSIVPWLVDSGPTWLGLDCSFQLTMNYALYHKMEWGEEIIATYGPLAFLCNRVMWGVSKEFVLFFDLFMLFNFGVVFRKFLLEHNKIFALCFLFTTLLILNIHTGSTAAFLMFFFSIYWMYDYDQRTHFFSIVISSICIAFCFYMKLNAALFTILFFLTTLANLSYFNKISKLHLLLSIIALFLLLYIPSILLNVNLIEYIKNGFYTIGGYNDIMFLNEEHFSIEMLVWLAFGFIAFYSLYQIGVLIKIREWSKIVYLLLIILYVFLAWKQSVLRNDMQHLSEFFACSVMIFYLGNSHKILKQQQKAYYVSISVAILVLFLGKLNTSSFEMLISNRFRAPIHYFSNYKSAEYDNYFSAAEKRKIPQRVLQQIGDETIDIFPWDVEYLLQHKLRYHPRPDFQSYMVYNKYLQDINYESYVRSPPKFIIYDYDAIDERYPFNDEGITNLFIASNYTLADTFTSNERLRLLLKRRPRPTPVFTKEIQQFTVDINRAFDVSEFDFIRIYVTYSSIGRIKSFLYKPSGIRINYMLKDGNWKSYRSSPSQLSAFVYTEEFIEHTRDFIQLLNQKNSLIGVSKIKIEGNSSNYSSHLKVVGFKYQSE